MKGLKLCFRPRPSNSISWLYFLQSSGTDQ